jgi:hypothetical protein
MKAAAGRKRRTFLTPEQYAHVAREPHPLSGGRVDFIEGRSSCPGEHRAGIVEAADGHDPTIDNVNVLREGDEAEYGVDIQDGHAMLPVHNQANNVDLFHQSAERLQGGDERLGASIGVQRKLPDDFRMQGQTGCVVATHRIDVLLHDLNDPIVSQTIAHNEELR